MVDSVWSGRKQQSFERLWFTSTTCQFATRGASSIIWEIDPQKYMGCRSRQEWRATRTFKDIFQSESAVGKTHLRQWMQRQIHEWGVVFPKKIVIIMLSIRFLERLLQIQACYGHITRSTLSSVQQGQIFGDIASCMLSEDCISMVRCRPFRHHHNVKILVQMMLLLFAIDYV